MGPGERSVQALDGARGIQRGPSGKLTTGFGMVCGVCVGGRCAGAVWHGWRLERRSRGAAGHRLGHAWAYPAEHLRQREGTVDGFGGAGGEQSRRASTRGALADPATGSDRQEVRYGNEAQAQKCG